MNVCLWRFRINTKIRKKVKIEEVPRQLDAFTKQHRSLN